ncbi:MAG: hypothetical protein ACRD0A_13975 [Acidimicrobiales bacterium]
MPLANAVEGFIGDQVDRFVASDAFEDIWVAVVRQAHGIAVGVLRGENEDIEISDGVVTINLALRDEAWGVVLRVAAR